MHKFFVPFEDISLNQAIVTGDDVKHIYKVLRLTEGTKVSINNCKGEEFLGEIEKIDKKQVIVNLKEKLDINNESKLEVYLFQGLPKSTKMDIIVQKNCELGVREITPVVTSRVVVKDQGKEFKKIDRWERIALEASKQSKRTIIPNINTPMKFEDMIERLSCMDLIVVPYENQQGFGIKNMINRLNGKDIKKVGIVIGPEGGFEEEEIDTLKNIGANIVTLGPRILRTETAGFTSVSIIMYELGDLGGII